MESNKDNINHIWERMKTGDEQCLSKIFIAFYSDMCQYGIKLFNSIDLVNDSIQDVFLRIWEKRDTLGNVQNLRAYLFASLRRMIFNNKKEFFNTSSLTSMKSDKEDNFLFSSDEFLASDEISVLLRQTLTNTINHLPEKQRELVFLRFYHKLSYRDCAVIMEIKEQTVRNLMQRALSKFREQMDPDLWFD